MLLAFAAVPRRRSFLLLALTGVALALSAAIAAPAAALPSSEPPEAAQLVSCASEVTALPARVDARAVERVVLSPGLHWVPLPEALPRMPALAAAAHGGARADEHTLPGWCLAHSTSTALP